MSATPTDFDLKLLKWTTPPLQIGSSPGFLKHKNLWLSSLQQKAKGQLPLFCSIASFLVASKKALVNPHTPSIRTQKMGLILAIFFFLLQLWTSIPPTNLLQMLLMAAALCLAGVAGPLTSSIGFLLRVAHMAFQFHLQRLGVACVIVSFLPPSCDSAFKECFSI